MSTIVTFSADDHPADNRADINANFANLNADKLEAASIANKANKVSSPVTNNFAGLTAGGDLQDSGHKHSDYAASVHTHAASDITSGTMAQARLGTGSTGTGSNFLADDQTYKTISVTFPTGFIFLYGASSAPTGYLLCDGASVLRSTYAALFAVIGTTYGSADGTHFNVPDLRGRVPVGYGTGTGGGASGTGLPTGGSALTAVSLGTWKGEETHVLTTGELASHSHTVQKYSTGSAGSQSTITFGTNETATPIATNLPATTSVGSDTAHNNIQPVMGVNYLIKT